MFLSVCTVVITICANHYAGIANFYGELAGAHRGVRRVLIGVRHLPAIHLPKYHSDGAAKIGVEIYLQADGRQCMIS